LGGFGKCRFRLLQLNRSRQVLNQCPPTLRSFFVELDRLAKILFGQLVFAQGAENASRPDQICRILRFLGHDRHERQSSLAVMKL
jgi:hypothetical protein